MPQDPVPQEPRLPTNQQPGMPSDAVVAADLTGFLAANPLEEPGAAPVTPVPPAPAPAPPVPVPVPVLAPNTAPTPTPTPTLTPTPTSDPAVAPAPFRVEDLLKAASPNPVVEPPVEPAEPVTDADDPNYPTPEEAKVDGPPRNAWTKIKSDLKTFKVKALDFEAKLRDAEAKLAAQPQVPADVQTRLEAAETRARELENEIGQIEITRSPEFKKRYDVKIENLHARAVDGIVALSDRTPEDANALMQALEKAKDVTEIRAILGTESADVRATATLALTEIRRELQVRQKAIEDWKSTRPLLETEATSEAQGLKLQEIVSTTADVAVALAKPRDAEGEGSWLFMDQPQDVEWTARRQQLLSSARAVLRDSKPEEIAKYVLEGAAARLYREFGEKQFQLVQELKAQLERRNKAIPRVQPGAPEARPASTPAREAVKPLDVEAGLTSLLHDFKAEQG